MMSNFIPPPNHFSAGNSYNYIPSGTWQYYQNRRQQGLNHDERQIFQRELFIT